MYSCTEIQCWYTSRAKFVPAGQENELIYGWTMLGCPVHNLQFSTAKIYTADTMNSPSQKPSTQARANILSYCKYRVACKSWSAHPARMQIRLCIYMHCGLTWPKIDHRDTIHGSTYVRYLGSFWRYGDGLVVLAGDLPPVALSNGPRRRSDLQPQRSPHGLRWAAQRCIHMLCTCDCEYTRYATRGRNVARMC